MIAVATLVTVVIATNGTPLTFEQALSLADRQSPELIADQLGTAISKAEVQTAGALPNPLATVSYGPDEPYLFGGIEQRLPIFGQRGTAIAAAEADVRASEAKVTWTRQRVRAQVRRLYFALAAAQAQAQVGVRLAELAKLVADGTKQRFDVGTASELDARQAALEHERATQEAVDRETQVREAQVALAQHLGLARGTDLVAADPLTIQPPSPSLLAETPPASHPEAVTARLEREAALARATRERVAVVPVPGVAVELQQPTSSFPRVGVRVTVNTDLPLLSWNRGPIHRAEAEAAQFAAQEQATVARVESARAAARARLEAAQRKALLYRDRLLPEARRVEELARFAYSVGKTPLASVLQAQSGLANDESQAIAAILQFQEAIADLEELSP
ncbi:TolC family protein [Vitiosangium sp. GDMCC 1.1324]|uniref:TolC family protein n=1 Tax=Vitiosangium sp. (strain GDMCC 1.1324) TaxID=2138576 RepID=UPI000D3B7692|nr:TolC family protein [Vitiosangium sp. GDMCC 1.1324]PTL77446.1 hypothetical protein DAT35_44390 [Vitiosangium sp. GDMCC 1.1324]